MGFEASGENKEKREVGWLDGLSLRGSKGQGGLVNRRWFLQILENAIYKEEEGLIQVVLLELLL